MTSVTKIQKIISDLQAAERDLHLNLSGSRENSQARTPLQAHLDHDLAFSALREENASLKDQINKLSSSLSLIIDQHKELETELSNLKNENKRLAQELYDAQKENIINKNCNNELTQDNETLISKILQVQIELEEYYQDKVALELALSKSTLALDSARIAICSVNEEN